ncbi:elongation of very long chain fatty acids protein AAEL008004-like [Ixodes scapularis]|uniref:elongation of very long chain fatty acids protein AAEL008004-like n=1 Tax=Ixodes scapularis TaxID=6945 RepID=UPI001A9E2419|nr:elongation of very long chain fatty acids protein AAEL008004-like [Ixodes scapularis]
MAVSLRIDFLEQLRLWLYSRADPRTRDWYPVGDPVFITGIVSSYFLFIYVFGPQLMASRKPLPIKALINVYNVFMVVSNAFFAYQFFANSYLYGGYHPLCQGMSYSTDKHSLNIMYYGYFYLFVRIADFLDTVFFVLRKKYDHITRQHVWHHALVVINGWLFLTLGCDGQTLFGVTMNCSIHVIMYTYYFLAACGPEYKKYIWWKKHLTTAQIVQHVLIIGHGFITLFYDCGYPRYLLLMAMPQGMLGLALFINFYFFEYKKKTFAEALTDNVCMLKRD